MRLRELVFASSIVAVAIAGASTGAAAPALAAPPTASPTPMPVPTHTASPTPMPVPTHTASPTPMPVPTHTASPTPMPVPTPTATATPKGAPVIPLTAVGTRGFASSPYTPFTISIPDLNATRPPVTVTQNGVTRVFLLETTEMDALRPAVFSLGPDWNAPVCPGNVAYGIVVKLTVNGIPSGNMACFASPQAKQIEAAVQAIIDSLNLETKRPQPVLR